MNAAVAQERWQGQIIDGKFPLLEWLGGSANTSVFRTEVPGPASQPAAIKLIRAEGSNAVEQIARWKESAALSHSNLLRIFDSGYCQITGAHWLYVVTELAEENLDQVLPVRPLSSAEVAEMLPPVLEALKFLHAKGLVHGRIKPSNILAVNNQLKLSTDSLQAANQKLREHVRTAFDAPEVGSGTLSDASDVWSLGMMLITAFHQRPITWSTASRQDPGVPKSVPAPYSQIATECLRTNPEERCSLDHIKQVLSRGAALPKPVVVQKTAAVKSGSKRRVFVPVAILVVLAAIIFFALTFRHSSTNTSQQPTASVEPATEPASTPGAAVNAGDIPARTGSTDGIVNKVTPQVPLSARETIHGKVKVKVRVSVNASGSVSSASLVSAGPSRYFARLALEASEKWKFTPVEGNQPAIRKWMLEYKFGRSGTEVTPVEVR